MKDLKINVSRETRMVNLPKEFISVDGENLQSNLVFEFSDEFVNGQARIEYRIKTTKNYATLTKVDETYQIPVKNVITKNGKIEMQLVITEGTDEEEIPVFKSNIFYLYCNESINAVDEAPDGYELWIEQANAKLNAMDAALDEVDNLDIDVSKSENIATVTITKKDGTQESAEITDGSDAKINGYNTITIEAGNNITLDQEGNTLTIGAEDSTTDYTELENKPSINNVTLNGNKTSSDLGLQPAGNYLTEETDPVFSASASAEITSTDISNWNAKSDFSGSYNDLTDKPTIPDSTSDLTNDSGFITNSTDGLTNYYTKTEVDSKVSAVYKYKGSVASYSNLPSTGLTIGDVYNVEDTGDNYAWTGTIWDKLSGTVDLSGYQTKIDSSHKLDADLVEDSNATNKFVTATDKSNWSAKYDKPSGGIPSTDLSSAVQTSLGKADTALQSETYTGTITSVKMNGSTIASSGEADLGTVITSHQSIKTINSTSLVGTGDVTVQPTLVSGTNIKTINNASLLGSGNIDTEIIQYSTMPTASASTVDKIVQYIGTTSGSYTNGYFYKGTSTTSGNETTYSWTAINVQAGGGGGSFDPTTVSGYDATANQTLSNEEGTLTWQNGTVEEIQTTIIQRLSALTSLEISDIAVVSSLPAQEQNGTIYFVEE